MDFLRGEAKVLAMLRSLLITAVCALGLKAAPASIQVRNESLRHEVERAIDRGVDWLVKSQNAEGWWSTTDQPAVTALALVALNPKKGEKLAPTFSRGYAFLEKHIQPDGSICNPEKGMVNYNTSIGLMAFAARGEDADVEKIRKARRYLVGTQIDMGEKGRLDTPYDGGIGYSSRVDFSDLANTVSALEALYVSERYAADAPNEPKLNFEAVRHFIQSCQNLPSHNKEPWVSKDANDLGGFIYHPGRSNAGTNSFPDGRIALRSYGSISYAGLLSYIYADVDKEDPRVKGVVKWLDAHYTLEENPGMGPQGLYYYYHMLAKALSAAGVESIAGKSWREALALKLLNLQKDDGSWQNENNRWWEKDSTLVTSYVVQTLRIIDSRL